MHKQFSWFDRDTWPDWLMMVFVLSIASGLIFKGLELVLSPYEQIMVHLGVPVFWYGIGLPIVLSILVMVGAALWAWRKQRHERRPGVGSGNGSSRPTTL